MPREALANADPMIRAGSPDAGRGRVMIFVHDLRASGVVRNTLAIARRVAKDHQVMLVARYDEGRLAAEVRSEEFALRSLFAGGRPVPLWSAARRLRTLTSEWKPDVILSSGNRGHWVVRLAALGREEPRLLFRISNSIDSGRRDFGLRSIATRLLAAGADTLFLVGTATGASRAFAGALAEGRARVITNGVDCERAARLAKAPAPSGYPGDDLPMLLSIGRLAPQKDFPTLVRAAAIAARQAPLRLVIVGKGEPTAAGQLRRLASAEGLGPDAFHLAGESDNVFAWLARAAVFVLPSRWEGSSMALLEALALDVPVVATRQAGDAEHVLDGGRHGLLVEAGDAEAMARAILKQLSPEQVRPNGRAAQFSDRETLERYAEGVNGAVARARQS